MRAVLGAFFAYSRQQCFRMLYRAELYSTIKYRSADKDDAMMFYLFLAADGQHLRERDALGNTAP